jgi:hypothetical protein
MGGNFDPNTLRIVETNGEQPLNIENTTSGRLARPERLNEDFLIFILSENISNDTLPDGTTRGFMRIASSTPATGTTYMIGVNNNFRGGLTAGYESCPHQITSSGYYHLCASTVSSSSSALTQLVDGEMVLTGMNSREHTHHAGQTVPTPDSLYDGNIGISMDTVRRYLNEQSIPLVLANGISI